MTATVVYLNDRQPISRPLPAPSMPSLATMVLTLQRDYVSALTWRELVALHRAAWCVAKGEDADDQEHVEQMRRVHPIWTRIMGSELGDMTPGERNR